MVKKLLAPLYRYLVQCFWQPSMIGDFRDKWLEAFYVEDASSKRIPADLRERLFRKLQLIDDSNVEADLRIPPSNPYERLRGHLDGLSSIRVNQQWRLIFTWDDTKGTARDIYLDNPSYR